MSRVDQGPPVTPYQQCAGTCERPIRPGKTKPDRYPGTVSHHSHGMCDRCHRHNTPGTETGAGTFTIDAARHYLNAWTRERTNRIKERTA